MTTTTKPEHGLARAVALSRLLGVRPALFFGLVTFVVVALLAAIQVSSRYALKAYADDQVARVPWDISVYQVSKTGLPLSDTVRDRIAAVQGIAGVENIYFLRTAVPTIRSYVDGEPLRSPWVSVLMTSNPDLLPPELRPATDGGAVLALLGKKSLTGDAFVRLQGTRRFELSETTQRRGVERRVFAIDINRVIRVERDNLNRWFMEQTSSPTFVPDVGSILVMPYNLETLLAFDAVGRGIELAGMGQDIHELAGKYVPEVIHLVRTEHDTAISTWDLAGTAARAEHIGSAVRAAAELHPGFTIGMDNTTGVLFERMAAIARQIGLLVLLVALPLLWMAWVLLANLARLVMLNERQRLGLLRLRGASGRMMGRALLTCVGASGLLGGCLGFFVGSWLPLRLYDTENLTATARQIQDPQITVLFISIGVMMVLLVARPLVRYAATISPVEAANQIAPSESRAGGLRFGIVAGLALLIGVIKLLGWVIGWHWPGLLPEKLQYGWLKPIDRGLDFIAFPLFIYGATVLVASRYPWLMAVLRPFARLRSREMAPMVLGHIAAKPHRASSLVLIVALMASIGLYPTVMTAVFDNKLQRAALVQLGGELQITFNVPDLAEAELATAADERDLLVRRFAAVRSAMARLAERLHALPEVADTTYVTEGLVEGLYMPGYGLEGVPIYFMDDAARYLAAVYHEPALGHNDSFANLVQATETPGQVLMSPPLWDFWERDIGEMVPVGRNAGGSTLRVPTGGSVNFMPGGIVTSVDDRDSFIAERINYLNHLFHNRAFVVASARNAALDGLDVLLPRVMLVVRAAPNVTIAALRDAVTGALPVPILRMRDLDNEVARLGSDMYVYLARENMRIYLIGGVLMALIGMLTVAYINYVEDRRILALLRTRGCGPRQMGRFLAGVLLGPSLLGLILGTLVALLVGFGMTNLIWELRDLESVMRHLPTRLALSLLGLTVFAALLAILLLVSALFRAWAFRHSAREGVA